MLQVQGKIDDNESQVAEMEEEIESLRLSNAKLENRNDLLVRHGSPHSQISTPPASRKLLLSAA